MKQLIAVSPILFESRNYEPGDELPTHNAGLVEIWTENGAAVWKEPEEPTKRIVKATPMTAPAGLPGAAYPSVGPEQDLIGKAPSSSVRGAQPEPAKRGRKKSD